MRLKIIKDCGFYELYSELWGGAVDTLKKIMAEGKTKEFMELLDEIFIYMPTEKVQVNTFVWFEKYYIYRKLNIEED